MKTKITKPKPSKLQKQLIDSIGAIDEIVAERDEAIRKMERLRQWELRPHGRKKGKLPAPRFEFEHVPSTEGWNTRWCIYWLVLPLGEYDIRREVEDKKPYKEWFVPLGETKSSGGRNEPPIYNGVVEIPFRNGAHAQWDCESLGGNIPIYATCGEVSSLIEHVPTKP